MGSRYLFNPKSSSQQVSDLVIKSLDGVTDSDDSSTGTDDRGFVQGYDLLDFFDDFTDLFKKYQEYTEELKTFSVQPENVHAHIGADEQNAIRFKILKRTNGTLSQGATPHEGRLNYKWTLTDVVEDKLNPGYKALVYAKWMDNTFEVLSCSKNYRDADRAAFVVENIFELHSNIFALKGLKQLRYIGRNQDRYREVANYGQYEIPLLYYCRTLKTQVVYEKILEELTIEKILK